MLRKKILADKYIFELEEIFKSKNWELIEVEEGEISIFDRFCERLVELDDDMDREFILELTKKYLYIDLGKYEYYLIDAVRKLFREEKEKIKESDKIFIFPVQDKEYLNKTKSANLICYYLQGILMRRFTEFHNNQIRIIETFEVAEKYKDMISYIILVDDYIGSGDTALECINLLEERGICKEKMDVLSLVSQMVGKTNIQNYGVNVYCSVERDRAITDNYTPDEVQKKLKQMKDISKKIKVSEEELYLGYKNSEGLVSMIKTPNNTFPFYWHECKRDGSMTVAPFPRRNNIKVLEGL